MLFVFFMGRVGGGSRWRIELDKEKASWQEQLKNVKVDLEGGIAKAREGGREGDRRTEEQQELYWFSLIWNNHRRVSGSGVTPSDYVVVTSSPKATGSLLCSAFGCWLFMAGGRLDSLVGSGRLSRWHRSTAAS